MRSRRNATARGTSASGMMIEHLERRLLLAGDCHFSDDSPASYARAVRVINCLAEDIYGNLQAESGNLLVSPASIATALAMFYEGTAGDSAAEMEDVLHLGSGPGIATSFARLFESFDFTLTELTGGRPPADAFDLAIANAFWPRVGVDINEDFANAIESDYGGTIREIDYGDRQAAIDTINAWVDENTRGRITELFEEPLPVNTVFTLTNSIYFKALWEMPFDPFNTRQDVFVRSDGTSTDVDMMFFSGCDSPSLFLDDPPSFLSWNTPHYLTQIDGFDILDRQLLGERSSLVFIMPSDPATPNEVPSDLLAKVDEWMSGPREPIPAMDVYLPKLKTTISMDILPLLEGMMPATFPAGDFSNLMEPQPLIDDARHKAVIEINEQGTEAAAVTSVSGIICFAAGTPIQTPDGDVPIEDIKAGDLVLSRNEHDENGPVQNKVVEETFSGEAEIWELVIEGRRLRVTELHRFFVLGKGWTSVGDMTVGDLLSSTDNEHWLTAESIVATGEIEPVYNFRVADYHTYFVGQQSWGFHVWTHNCCGNEPNFPTFRADRPFHFMVRENQTSSILFMGRIDDPTQAENRLTPTVQGQHVEGDFDGNSSMDAADADALALAIVLGENNPDFDLTSDRVVNEQDLDRWRVLAGAANLSSGSAYPRGDANLDGRVNAMDLNVVGAHWLQRDTSFSGGDLNADGIVDVIDLNRVGSRWLEDVSGVVVLSQREPIAPLAAAVDSAFESCEFSHPMNRLNIVVGGGIANERLDACDATVGSGDPTPATRFRRKTMTRRVSVGASPVAPPVDLETAFMDELFEVWT